MEDGKINDIHERERRLSMNPKKRPVHIPKTKPMPKSPEDLAGAIFRDADRRLAEKLAAQTPRQ